MCGFACRVVQTLHFAGQAIVALVRVHIPVYRCCMACNRQIIGVGQGCFACDNP